MPIQPAGTMKEQAYAAARAAAPSVRAHLLYHISEAQKRGEMDLPVIPDEMTIASIIDAAFWASLRREEGYVPKISLAFVTREESASPLLFERPVPLEPAALTRLGPAVERPGIHLGVSFHGETLAVWGTVRSIPKYSCVVEVSEPGLLVVKHHRGEAQAKFVNLAVLQGDQVKVIDEHASSLPDCPSLLSTLLGFDSPASWAGSMNVMVQLAVSMRAHGRGGLMLVVPAGTQRWLDSVMQPLSYAVSPPFSELATLIKIESEAGRDRAWRDELARAVDGVAGLTAIDGATVLTSNYDVLTFGAKITRRRGAAPVDQLTLTEPIEGIGPEVVSPGQLGGTRHVAAAQFVHDQRDGLALVASQDGRFTVFAWSPCEGMVHAHRIETLLL
jgi:hypothetical protein